ncbi:MAG: 4-hydroxythreonine-4-phosphate dehydrogenase PdxA [Desulfobacterales bacterium]|nr:4-hydroxythreonine-4-phosphate dehydrogenase PdxA [Desulfobacterales bacterium]
MSELPLIGITMGDPAGIGPEIIVKALADRDIYDICRPVVLGDASVLSSTILKAPHELLLNRITGLSGIEAVPGKIDFLPVSTLKADAVQPGRPTIEGGRAMVAYIFMAVEMCLKGELGAMVTSPINKALMHNAGHVFEGHTQLIAQLTDCDEYVMMLAGKTLRVALVTIHCPLKDVPARLDIDMIFKTIAITAEALRKDFGLEKPRVAVASLNPHAGESGLFGLEEEEVIGPAVKKAVNEGYHVEGPFPSDSLFYKAASGQFDTVVAMYHDQGLIPLKLLHFSDAVNVTLGLPIIRTSVDHGTAYDIAGTNQADASSLKAAIDMAAMMARNRNLCQQIT